MRSIERPLATVSIAWLSADEGGRRAGPPTATVYMATCAFPDRAAADPDRSRDAGPTLSILIEGIGTGADGDARARIGFLMPELARPHLVVGAVIDVLEGPRLVGRASVREVHDVGRDPSPGVSADEREARRRRLRYFRREREGRAERLAVAAFLSERLVDFEVLSLPDSDELGVAQKAAIRRARERGRFRDHGVVAKGGLLRVVESWLRERPDEPFVHVHLTRWVEIGQMRFAARDLQRVVGDLLDVDRDSVSIVDVRATAGVVLQRTEVTDDMAEYEAAVWNA